MCWLSWNLGPSTSWNPQGLSRPAVRLLCLYFSFTKHRRLTACMERHSTSQLVLWRGGWTKSIGLQARPHSPTSYNPLSSHSNHTSMPRRPIHRNASPRFAQFDSFSKSQSGYSCDLILCVFHDVQRASFLKRENRDGVTVPTQGGGGEEEGRERSSVN
jgi:hypothetical protein